MAPFRFNDRKSTWRRRDAAKPIVMFLIIYVLVVQKQFDLSSYPAKQEQETVEQPLHSTSSHVATNDEDEEPDRHYKLPVEPYFDFKRIVQEENLAQAFNPKFLPSSYNWCTERPYNGTHAQGLLYNKMPKAASSTIAGVAMRIAENHKRINGKNCPTQTMHMSDYSVGKRYRDRNKGNSFFFSSLRDPKSRGMSRIFFTYVSDIHKIPSDENIIDWLRTETDSQYGAISPGMGGFQLAYMAMKRLKRNSAWNETRPDEVLNPSNVHEIVRTIVDDYDMIMLVDRLDESLVAMQLLLGMQTKDILYLSSKQSGGYYFKKFTRKEKKADKTLGKNDGKCVFSVKSVVSEGVKEYLSSKEWYAQSYGDYLLIEAANQSLDLTINALGKERFHEAHQKFLKMKEEAERICGPTAVFPCSADGQVQEVESRDNCYLKDAGCGYPCLDANF